MKRENITVRGIGTAVCAAVILCACGNMASSSESAVEPQPTTSSTGSVSPEQTTTVTTQSGQTESSQGTPPVITSTSYVEAGNEGAVGLPPETDTIVTELTTGTTTQSLKTEPPATTRWSSTSRTSRTYIDAMVDVPWPPPSGTDQTQEPKETILSSDPPPVTSATTIQSAPLDPPELSPEDIAKIEYKVGSIRNGVENSRTLEITDRSFMEEFFEKVNALPFGFSPTPLPSVQETMQYFEDGTKKAIPYMHEVRFLSAKGTAQLIWRWSAENGFWDDPWMYVMQITNAEEQNYMYAVTGWQKEELAAEEKLLQQACTNAYLNSYGIDQAQIIEAVQDYVKNDPHMQLLTKLDACPKYEDILQYVSNPTWEFGIFPNIYLNVISLQMDRREVGKLLSKDIDIWLETSAPAIIRCYVDGLKEYNQWFVYDPEAQKVIEFYFPAILASSD